MKDHLSYVTILARQNCWSHDTGTTVFTGLDGSEVTLRSNSRIHGPISVFTDKQHCVNGRRRTRKYPVQDQSNVNALLLNLANSINLFHASVYWCS